MRNLRRSCALAKNEQVCSCLGSMNLLRSASMG